MDYFGREHLQELLADRGSPTVSIYMPTERTGSGVNAQSLRFRALLGRARDLLAGANGTGATDLLAPAEGLVGDAEFWRHQADGLAIFLAPGYERVYRLAFPLPELVVVGANFHTRPLLELLQAPDRFWILGLSQKEVRMWEGSAAGLSAVDLSNVPQSLQEALGRELVKDSHGLRVTRGRGRTPIFYGQGAGKDDSKAELEKFFRSVDAGVRNLLDDEIGPVILAAVDYYHPIYHSVSKLSNLMEDGIHGNVMSWDPEKLFAAAWPIAEHTMQRNIEQALNLWEGSYGKGKVESDLQVAGRLAVAGRVRLLLTEKGRRLWGTMDRVTGEMEILEEGVQDPGDHAVELLDEVSEVSIQHGGRALLLPPDRMPTDTGLAVVLR